MVNNLPSIPNFPAKSGQEEQKTEQKTTKDSTELQTNPIKIEQEKIDYALINALRDKTAQGRQSHFRLIQVMIDNKQTHAALAHLDSYQENWGANLESQRLRADAFRKTRQYNQAKNIYKTIIQTQTNNAMAWYGLGRTSIEQGELQSAIPHLEKAINLNPNYLEALADIGLVHMLLNHKEASLSALNKANELAGNTSDTLSKLALWALVYQDFGMAKQVAEQLNWDEATRNQALNQAAKIREQFYKQDQLSP